MAKGYVAGIPGSGGADEMKKSVYDTNDNGVVDKVDTVPTDSYENGEMVRYEITTGNMEGTGDLNTNTTVDYGDKTLICKSVVTESASVAIGPGVILSDRGGFVQNKSNVTGKDFVMMDYEVDDTGTQKPIYYQRAAKVVRDIVQPDDATTMIGITSYNVVPTIDQDIARVYVKLVNPVTNYRARVTSDVTGEVVKYIPSRNDWDNGTGLDFAAGERFFDLDSPLAEGVGYPLTVEVLADQSIDVLGDGTNPWRAVDSQNITPLQIIDESDIALESVSTSLIDGGTISEASPTTIDIAAGSGRVVSIDGNGVATVTPVSWPAQSGIAITNIATQIATRIGVDQNGVITQLPIDLTPETLRDYVNLGGVYHASGSIGTVINDGIKSQEVYSQLIDSIEVLGVTRKKGLAVSANADLTFNKTSGEIQSSGGGNDAGTRGQNIVRISGETPANFSRILGTTDDIESTGQTLIDPGFYDSGSGTKVAIGAPAQQATIQYVYQSIVDPAGVLVMYGQTVYPTLDDALLNADLDVVERPTTIEQETNLIARIVVTTDATDLQDESKSAVLAGVRFGSGIDGTLAGSISGGGDYLGAASSSLDELHTFADASGKVGKASSDISALNGVIQRITGNGDLILSAPGIGRVIVRNSIFKDGDAFEYPTIDGNPGDKVTTDGAGGLTLSHDGFEVVTTSTTLEYENDHIYVDSSAGAMTLTLGDNPRLGERKRFWMGDNSNAVELISANPTFPIAPTPPPAEANIQGMWTLNSDFADRFTTGRDLTTQGTGGSFVPVVVNGNNVNGYDFQSTAFIDGSGVGYAGILGGSARSMSCWYQANNGQPATDQCIMSFGEDVADGGGSYWEVEFRVAQGYLWVNNRNAWRSFPFADLAAVNLFDGNMHHIAVTQSTANMSSVVLYIDGVQVLHNAQDTFPNCNTKAGSFFKVGVNYAGNAILDGVLYDVRLFNRGLTAQEVVEVQSENILGGVTLSALNNDMVVDVTWNGFEWAVGAGTESLLGGVDGRLTDLEAAAMLGTGAASTVANQLVTFADTEGSQASNASDVTALTGVLSRDSGDAISVDVGLSVTSTTAAFIPPQVTTAQRLAIAPLGIVFDTDIGEQFVGNGLAWTAQATTTSVVGSLNTQDNLALTGVFQPITTGTFKFFDVNGNPETPTISSGTWTVPAGAAGTYQFNISGVPFTGAGSETQARFYTSINGVNYGAGAYKGLDQITKNGSGLTIAGLIKLADGDEVQIAYSILTGTGWELDNFRWDFSRLS